VKSESSYRMIFIIRNFLEFQSIYHSLQELMIKHKLFWLIATYHGIGFFFQMLFFLFLILKNSKGPIQEASRHNRPETMMTPPSRTLWKRKKKITKQALMSNILIANICFLCLVFIYPFIISAPQWKQLVGLLDSGLLQKGQASNSILRSLCIDNSQSAFL